MAVQTGVHTFALVAQTVKSEVDWGEAMAMVMRHCQQQFEVPLLPRHVDNLLLRVSE